MQTARRLNYLPRYHKSDLHIKPVYGGPPNAPFPSFLKLTITIRLGIVVDE